ncbi:YybH family protein [Lysobacter claricitrinus]|uniref:YybH family protein n=1 Tax=Lysobacter claricitrinus TaxID=3367728 RepID=UPI0037DB5782
MSDETLIRALIQRWHAATAAGDVDTVLTLMTEDAEFIVPGKPPMKGRRAFETGLRSLLQTHRITSSGDVQEVRVSGDLAFAVTRLSVRVAPIEGDGNGTSRSGYALSIFARQPNGDWQLVRDANLLPAPG